MLKKDASFIHTLRDSPKQKKIQGLNVMSVSVFQNASKLIIFLKIFKFTFVTTFFQ